ncbi:protein a6 [Drosophila busckii]|uniref:protein a6 n=1 Tax=Drosophila busckii TaxID=30019 RepID=UPI00083EB698|nr:protein a6 [Drosophila busckii]
MTTKHSEPFYISANLFDNRRLKRRICKWMERVRERRQHAYSMAQALASNSKTEQQLRRQRCQLMLPRRHVAAALPVDITIDLLSDDSADDSNELPAAAPPAVEISLANSRSSRNNLYAGSLTLSRTPNITLVPVELAPAQSSSSLLLMPAAAAAAAQSGSNCKRRRYGHVTSTTTQSSRLNESILLTSDEEEELNEQQQLEQQSVQFNYRSMRSPPPLAPLTFSETIEEVTVSLVPRSATTANCQARHSRGHSSNGYSTPTTTSPPQSNYDDSGFLKVDVSCPTLPDETTVHTVIANRIYELSLSKLREGLASSGVSEYANHHLPQQLKKLSPAMRAKVAPMVPAPQAQAPISLKLSSDLSISLISDDDECGESGGGGGAIHQSAISCGKQPVAAAEAHAAARLLKKQQPQLSVVQHLQYPGHVTPVALPVVVATLATPTTQRRRKLG